MAVIKLKMPPWPAKEIRQIVHMNQPSASPGGKDYVLAERINGEVWACHGPSQLIRAGRGKDIKPKKSFWGQQTEKTNGGYTVVGGLQNGTWYSNVSRDSYFFPVPQPATPPPVTPAPKPTPQPVQPKQQTPAVKSLAEQYPLSKKIDLGGTGQCDWFFSSF